jgi:monoamine oxidase
MRCDVVVVGAGLSGLVAAHRLIGPGTDAGGTSPDVVVLEAADRIGGRVLNLRIDDETIVEGGGEWIGPGQDRVAALARELGVDTFMTYDHGRHVIVLDGVRKTYRGPVPSVFPRVTIDFARTAIRLQLLSRRVDPVRPWTATGAADLDATTLAGFLDQHCRTGAARTLFTALSGLTFGGDPADLSLLGVLAHIHAAGGLTRLIAVRGGAQERRFVGGSAQLTGRLAAGLGPRVRTAHAVTAIAWSERGVTVTTGAGEPVTARRVIVAISPPDRTRIRFDPPLPAATQAFHEQSGAFKGLKVHAVYPTPFWRDAGLSGQAVADRGPAAVCFDNSPPDGRLGVLTGFVAGVSTADAITPTPAQLADPDARRRAVLDCFATYVGPRAAQPTGYLEQDWRTEPFISGCIPSLPPGLLTSLDPDHGADRAGAVVWAGTEQAHTWNGYLDGAVRAGESAAALVRAELRQRLP